MVDVFLEILNINFAASLLIIACIVIRYVFKAMPKYMRCLLWILVLVKLICPVVIESPFSVVPSREKVSSHIESIFAMENFETLSENPYDINSKKSAGTEVVVVENKISSEKDKSENDAEVKGSKARMDIAAVLSGIWLIGMMTSYLYAIVSYIRLKRCISDAVLLRNNIYQTERTGSPFVLGIIRPRIYVPYGLSSSELYFVLSHEKAHISRKDHWVKPISFVIVSVYWFNPLVWVAYVLLCRDIELACDEKAVRTIGYDKRKEYSQSILNLSMPRRYISACPVAFGEIGVKERVRSVLSMKKNKKIVIAVTSLIIFATSIGFLTYPKNQVNANETKDDIKEEISEEMVEKNDDNIVDSKDETYQIYIMKDMAKGVTPSSEEKSYYAVDTGDGEKDQATILFDKDTNVSNEDTGDSQVCTEIEFEGVASSEIPTQFKLPIATDELLISRNYSKEHEAVDFVSEEGTSVYCVEDGNVMDVGYDAKRGNYIEIQNVDGDIYIYHNLQSEASVSKGETVSEGQIIGRVGSTGESTGPHLHFAVRLKDGSYTDPIIYLLGKIES